MFTLEPYSTTKYHVLTMCDRKMVFELFELIALRDTLTEYLKQADSVLVQVE